MKGGLEIPPKRFFKFKRYLRDQGFADIEVRGRNSYRGEGTFRNRFNYFTGQWVTIEGLKYRPSLNDIRAYLVHTDYEVAADFECSNELLNWIHDTTMLTFEDLSLGVQLGRVIDSESLSWADSKSSM